MQLRSHGNRLTSAGILFLIGLLLAGLWPFNFAADNHAVLMPDGGGLRFDAPAERSKQDLGGIAFTPNPLICLPKGGCDQGAITIEIELGVENEDGDCLKKIVELCRPDGSEAFFLAQWKSSFIVRTFIKPYAGGNKSYNEMGIDGIFAAGRRVRAAIVSMNSETAIYINGQPVKCSPGVRLLKENETLDGHKIFFGNSPNLSCPWSGSVRAFAICGKALTSAEIKEALGFQSDNRSPCGSAPAAAVAFYRFDALKDQFISDLSGSANHLWKPDHLVFEKPPLGLPSGHPFPLSDFALNLLGFMPLGFLLYFRFRSSGRVAAKNRIIFSVAAGFAASLMIELIQVWLPGRDSSALDLVSNTVGTAVGALGGIWHESRQFKRYS
jgi:VanZ family protein